MQYIRLHKTRFFVLPETDPMPAICPPGPPPVPLFPLLPITCPIPLHDTPVIPGEEDEIDTDASLPVVEASWEYNNHPFMRK